MPDISSGRDNGNGNNNGNSTQTSLARPFRDYDGNEITGKGKLKGSLLLAGFIILCCFVIIAIWPDRLPVPGERVKPIYYDDLFHIELAGIPDSVPGDNVQYIAIMQTSMVPAKGEQAVDSPRIFVMPLKPAAADTSNAGKKIAGPVRDGLIHLNTILMLLVVASSCLGNLIHLSTSFSAYIGAGRFRSSWIVWYCIKPFTAAGLGLAIYFILRGGLLNINDNSSSINLYGIVIISLLAGLFTERTTTKLKEVFDVLLRPQERLPDQLEVKTTALSIEPGQVTPGKTETFRISGQQLDKNGIEVTIDDIPVVITDRKPKQLSFDYTLPAESAGKATVTVKVMAEDGSDLNSFQLQVIAVEQPAAGQE